MYDRLNLPENIAPLKDRLDIRRDKLGAYRPRGDVAPGALVPTAISRRGKRNLEWMRWGLIPHWADDTKIGYRSFIARADLLTTAPRFCDAWTRGQRCLVIASAIYEMSDSAQCPFAFGRSDNQPMLIAGLWDAWQPRGHDALRSCAILAANADSLRGSRQADMPIILDPADCCAWLGEEPIANIAALLKPFPLRRMTMRPLVPRAGGKGNGARPALAGTAI